MRNLKRVLALALALVMMLGMMITASAATYADQAAIDEDYADAVEILSGMGVFQGTGAGFAPKQVLTRAEAAALVYRVITGDVNDKQIDLYDYSSFADVEEGKWYTGYITYAANGGYIKGYAGNAMPGDTVTGIQVLAMMLRAAGYGQNGEFEGAAWKDNILTEAKELGITAGIATNDLDKGATRELVAQLIWNAIYKVKMVAYSPILSTYIPVTVKGVNEDGKITFNATQTLAQKVFDLAKKGDTDHWGRPADIYYEFDKGPIKGKYATIEAIPEVSYTTKVTQCDVAKDLGLKDDVVDAALVLNGDAVTGGQDIYLEFAPYKTIGEQGRLTEIYNIGTPSEPVYKVVQVDQYLAKVLDVTEMEYDKNGHVYVDASLTLMVYDAKDGSAEKFTLYSDKKNFTDYTPYAMVLINYDWDAANEIEVEYVADAEYITGSQTSHTNKATHVVEGTEYPDAIQFNHDEAVTSIGAYDWYFDTYGNLIGSFEVATKYSFGVVSAIKWVEMDELLEKGYALAAITYMDGTTENAKIFSIEKNGVDIELTSRNVSETMQNNDAAWVHQALYKIHTTNKGLVLEETSKVTASIETGVPKMTTDIHSGNATQYLVWNKYTKSYETYTGIKNVPSYNEGTIWYADTTKPNADGVIEYAFITADATASTKTVTYFWNTNVYVEDVMHKIYDIEDYYVIYGGYVNGVQEAIKTKDVDIANAFKDTENRPTADILYTLTVKGGYVTEMNPVEGGNDVFVPSLQAYATYAGSLKDAVLAQDVLVMADGTSFDVEGAAEITYEYGLKKTINLYSDLDVDKAYVYIIYTKNPAKVTEKIASLIYITDIPGATYIPAPEAPTYDDAVDAATAALAKAAVATTLAEKTALVNGDLKDAYALLADFRNTGDAEKDAVVAGLYAALANYSEQFKTDIAEADAIAAAEAAVEAAEADVEAAEAKAEETQAARSAAYRAKNAAAAAVAPAETAAETAAEALTVAQFNYDVAAAAAETAEETKESAYDAWVASGNATGTERDAYDAAVEALAAAEADLAEAQTALTTAQTNAAEKQAALTAAQAEKTATYNAWEAAIAADEAADEALTEAEEALEAAEEALEALQA